jgi:LPPG:FO 2-phospho-L-lactate transferase
MANHILGVICGGSGSSKFVRAIKSYLDPSSFRRFFIANVADNFWHYGLYICPDVDILMYSLADLLDEERGWGIRNDTYNFLGSYRKIHPTEAWFNLGDADLGFSLRRTELINKGWKLGKIVDYFCQSLQVRETMVPSTDDDVQTFVRTKKRRMHLQEFWVKKKGKPNVLGVEQRGISQARPAKKLDSALSENVLILPANPVSSILPTIKLKGVKEKLSKARNVVAISPFLGKKPFSGPAGKFMRALDLDPSSLGIAILYSEFLKTLVVDSKEETSIIQRVRDLGVECVKANTRIESNNDEERIVAELYHLF